MVTKRVHSPKALATAFLGTLFFVGVVMFLIIGGTDFAKKYPKVLHYTRSLCRVNSTSHQEYKCHSRYSTYTCYGPIWNAYYGPNQTIYAKVEIEKRYRKLSDAVHKAEEYQIGMSYSCWYDTRKFSVAQWDQPSVHVQIILLACGGLSIVLSIMFCSLTYRLVRQEKLQNEHGRLYS